METELTTFAGPFAVDTVFNLSEMFSSESTISNSLVSASTRIRILLRGKKAPLRTDPGFDFDHFLLMFRHEADC